MSFSKQKNYISRRGSRRDNKSAYHVKTASLHLSYIESRITYSLVWGAEEVGLSSLQRAEELSVLQLVYRDQKNKRIFIYHIQRAEMLTTLQISYIEQKN